jgi:hypothetical protein
MLGHAKVTMQRHQAVLPQKNVFREKPKYPAAGGQYLQSGIKVKNRNSIDFGMLRIEIDSRVDRAA